LDLDRVSVIKLGTRGAASAKKPMTAGGIFHNQADELVGIHKHEAKILLDLCKEKNMKNCDQKGRRKNLSIFYEVSERKKKPHPPMSKGSAKNGTKFMHLMGVVKSI
jgi:hypothetical protein